MGHCPADILLQQAVWEPPQYAPAPLLLYVGRSASHLVPTTPDRNIAEGKYVSTVTSAAA